MVMFGVVGTVMKGAGVIVILQLFVEINCSLNITKMTAPLVADPREDMQLQCRFNMGSEELFAVKWYKDDHEFFRYIPTMKPDTLKFPVAGVSVVSDPQRTQCKKGKCDLLLTNLSRHQSSGEYRCEVSSEAPAFRIAGRTLNVSVAALPKEKPKIEDLLDSYEIGDHLIAKCISAPGDPKPHLSFTINKQPVPSKYVRELPTPFGGSSFSPSNLSLETREIQLRLQLERRHVGPTGHLELQCVQTVPEVPMEAAPPLTTARTVVVIDHNFINNQKLHWPSSLSGGSAGWERGISVIMMMVLLQTVIKWC